jgi:SAM-dependent methyltransferase
MRDYRNSHQGEGKAKSYHSQFVINPYRAMVWTIERAILDELVKTYFTGMVPTHLDFACGTGRVLAHLAPKVEKSTGVDVSLSMLDVARSEVDDVELICGDMTQDDLLGSRKFALITAFRFFPNAQPELRRGAMKALVARLDDEGIFIFNNHKNHSSSIYLLGRIFGRQGQREMKMSEVDELVAEAGLKVVETRHIGAFPSIDRLRLLPIFLLAPLERLFSRQPALAKLSSNVIYVCQKVSS